MKIKIESQLGNFFGWLSQCLKAGLSLPQAFQLAAEDQPSPLKEELCTIIERMHRGMTLEESLQVSEEKLHIPDFSLMVHSILILREAGGNVVLHFENLSTILRERQKVSDKINLLTSQSLMQGKVLSLMPLGLALLLFLLSPKFLSPLWETRGGWGILGVIVMLDLGGWLWMKRLGKVEI